MNARTRLLVLLLGGWGVATPLVGVARGDVTLVKDGTPAARIYVTTPAASPDNGKPMELGRVLPGGGIGGAGMTARKEGLGLAGNRGEDDT